MITETTTQLIQQGRATDVQSAKRLIEISRLENLIDELVATLQDCYQCCAFGEEAEKQVGDRISESGWRNLKQRLDGVIKKAVKT